MLVFSVIVPVYNNKQFLSRCVNSILCQSFTNFELILVDDGSTDDSNIICDEFAQKDLRVRVLHKENGGVSSARNLGLENAEGEWVLFVDSDDYLCNDICLDSISKTITAHPNSELVYFAGQTVLEEGTYNDSLSSEVYDYGYQCLENNCLKRKCIVFGSIFVQCYKKSIIDVNHLRFDNSILYAEDRLFVCSYYLVARKTIVLPDVIYSYVLNDNSLMHDESRKTRLSSDQRKAVKLIEGQMKETGKDLPHMRKYLHGLYVKSIDGLKRKEVDWEFVFRNASTVKLKIKDLLLFFGVNTY